ncbi:hypothetical protein E3A20_11190 [Planctomyces bekefii]|uniref:Uncharacterized protein n=1 Tax=Planctomyces bekefii TaxID=1653850 RepID=A0A5C6M6X3_9PLAN|nr:hypothetical protein E3A20_11190 [Planctomyces bekefii]
MAFAKSLTSMSLMAILACSAGEAEAQQGGRRQVDCSRPKRLDDGGEESAADNAAAPGAFVPNTPNGAVRGGSNTLGINTGAIRIPAMTLALPTIHLPSLSRVRRGAAMLVDEHEAPYVEGGIADFEATPKKQTKPNGQEESASDKSAPESTGEPETRSEPEDAPRCNPPCVPAVPREGCLTQNGATSDAQVARLEAQMAVLQQAVTQLVQVQVQANAAAAQQQRSQAVPAMPAAAPAAPATVRPAARPRQVEQEPQLEVESAEQPVDVPTVVARPVRQISAAEGEVRVSAEARQLRQQAAQIEELQRQLDELKRAQTPAAKAPAASPAANVSAGAAKATGAGTAGRAKLGSEPQAKKSMNPFSGLLGGLSKGR